jgi:ABC-type uncharacterized transport system ATPase subunit
VGVEGNGQRALALALAGLEDPVRSSIDTPDRVGLIPEDRGTEGLIAEFDLRDNVGLALHDDPAFRSGPFMRLGKITEATRSALVDFDVRAMGPRVTAGTLSGGNQQKVVVARELKRGTDLLVAENPTRGLDIAAAAYVHRVLLGLRHTENERRRPGVVLISTDLDEVISLADRIFVIIRGRLVSVPHSSRSREAIGHLMLGGIPPEV